MKLSLTVRGRKKLNWQNLRSDMMEKKKKKAPTQEYKLGLKLCTYQPALMRHVWVPDCHLSSNLPKDKPHRYDRKTTSKTNGGPTKQPQPVID